MYCMTVKRLPPTVVTHETDRICLERCVNYLDEGIAPSHKLPFHVYVLFRDLFLILMVGEGDLPDADVRCTGNCRQEEVRG